MDATTTIEKVKSTKYLIFCIYNTLLLKIYI